MPMWKATGSGARQWTPAKAASSRNRWRRALGWYRRRTSIPVAESRSRRGGTGILDLPQLRHGQLAFACLYQGHFSTGKTNASDLHLQRRTEPARDPRASARDGLQPLVDLAAGCTETLPPPRPGAVASDESQPAADVAALPSGAADG